MKQAKLIEYGIQNEDSHLRAHVCPQVRRVYVYPTPCGVEALENGIETLGYQCGVEYPTANGKRVPPFSIRNCVALQVNKEAWDGYAFSQKESTSHRGKKATRFVLRMLKNGIFPLPLGVLTDANLSRALEVKGRDIHVWTKKGRIIIQVKCDFVGGEKELGGSGYLYLQTAECNPLKMV